MTSLARNASIIHPSFRPASTTESIDKFSASEICEYWPARGVINDMLHKQYSTYAIAGICTVCRTLLLHHFENPRLLSLYRLLQ